MTSLRIVVCAVAAAALALPPAASAEPPRTALDFASAAHRLHVAFVLHTGTIERAIDAADYPACERALARGRVPRRVRDDVTNVFANALFQGPVLVMLPPMRQFVADLEAVPTRDPLLRSGRAGWRAVVAEFADAPVLDRPCAQLDAWACAGYRRDARPDFPYGELREAWSSPAASAELAERKIVGAARRLRVLGIGRRAASRFTGEHLFDALLDDLSDAAGAGEASSPSTR